MATQDSTRTAVGDKVGGVFGLAHGIGETLRGSINSALDGAGDAVTGKQSAAGTTASGEHNPSVARTGLDEVKESLAKLQGGSTTRTGTTTTTGATSSVGATGSNASVNATPAAL